LGKEKKREGYGTGEKTEQRREVEKERRSI